jgi:hypothetical protein
MLPEHGVPVAPLIDHLSHEPDRALLREIAGPEQRGVMPAFYVRRFFRIVPLWFKFFAVGVLGRRDRS